jgi:hypothetical protein
MPMLIGSGEFISRTPSPILREISEPEYYPILFVNTTYLFQQSKELRLYNNLKASALKSNAETKKTYLELCRIENTARQHGVTLNSEFAEIISTTEQQIIRYDLAIIEFGSKLKEHATRLATKYQALCVIPITNSIYIHPNCDITLELLEILNDEYEILFGEQ